jgi:hypothetical protein
MGELIIIGTTWISVSVICLWFNYRFHRFYMSKDDREPVLDSLSFTIKSNEWNEELKASRSY